MAPLLSRLGVCGGNGGFGFGKRRVSSAPPPIVATGGNLANGLAPGNGYKYHTFGTNGTFTVTSGTGSIEVLLVAGGGGGGNGGGDGGGGGGAGGVRYYPVLPITPGSYPITVGPAGSGAPYYNIPGTRGGNSTAFGKTANGGGHTNYGYASLGPGGSGAGRSHSGGSAGSGNVGGNDPLASPASEGNGGGGSTYPGGGGGGAGGPGEVLNGGIGLQFPNFTGPLIGVPALAPLSGYYGGGGATGGDGYRGTGGLGGGGNGGSRSAGGVTPGVTYSGGGGGGDSGVLAQGSPGGSGIVIIRYLA